MEFSHKHAETLHDVLNWRRDIRHFLPDALSEAEIEPLRHAMDMAPSVGNARPWRVIQVSDPVLRKSVRDEFASANNIAAKEYSGSDKEEYLQLKLAGLEVAPLQLAVFTETEPEEGRGLGRQTIPETLKQSTTMAIYNLWLTARATNIGVGMVSILDPQKIKQLFDVPNTWDFTAYLCIGKPAFLDDTPLLHRTGWQVNSMTEWQKR